MVFDHVVVLHVQIVLLECVFHHINSTNSTLHILSQNTVY